MRCVSFAAVLSNSIESSKVMFQLRYLVLGEDLRYQPGKQPDQRVLLLLKLTRERQGFAVP